MNQHTSLNPHKRRFYHRLLALLSFRCNVVTFIYLLFFLILFCGLLMSQQWYDMYKQPTLTSLKTIKLYKFYSSSHTIVSTTDEIIDLFATKSLICHQWVSTRDCDGYGKVELNQTKTCQATINVNESGYCEYKDDTGQLYQIGARDCDSERNLFSCSSILFDVRPQMFQTVETISAAKTLVEQANLQCEGFYGTSTFYPTSVRSPNKDKWCNQTVSATTSGFCVYQNVVTHEFYRIMPKNASSFMMRCDNITAHHPLYIVEDYIRLPLGNATAMKQFPLKKLQCIGFYGLVNYGDRRNFGADKTVDVDINLPAKGWCEYEYEGLRYRAYMNETRIWKKVKCTKIAEWYTWKYVFVNGLSNIEQVFHEHQNLQCIGFKRTKSCAPKDPTLKELRGGEALADLSYSGFCEFYEKATQTYYALAPFECHYMKHFRCNYLQQMITFKKGLNELVKTKAMTNESEAAPPKADTKTSTCSASTLHNETCSASFPKLTTRGIVLSIYPNAWIEAYVLLRLLSSYHTTLPIELWTNEHEWENEIENMLMLLDVYEHGTVTLRFANMTDYIKKKPVNNQEKKTQGYLIKVYSLLHTNFDEVLLMDIDSYPVRNPEYLFDLPEYEASGAIFWPDYWHFQNTMFARLDSGSYLWDMLDLPYVDMAEQESGQILIHRNKSKGPLRVLDYFLHHYELLYIFVWGDKDFYRLSWLKYNQPFYMVSHRPGSLGTVTTDYNAKKPLTDQWREDGDVSPEFCGLSIVQFDPTGQILFFHRNGGKFSKPAGNQYMWDYIQIYDIQGYGEVVYYGPCYQYAGRSTVLKVAETPYADLEEKLLLFYDEGAALNGTKVIRSNKKKVPEYYIPDMEQYNRIGELVNNGYQRMAKNKLVMCALIRDSDIAFSSMISTIETTGKYFSSYEVVLLEDGSTDDTRKIAEEWKSKNDRVSFVPMEWKNLSDSVNPLTNAAVLPKFMGDTSDARLLQMSKLRSQLLNSCRQKEHDYIAIFDGDLSNGWSIDGIASSFGLLPESKTNHTNQTGSNLPWDVVCSNAVVKDQGRRYYDSLAFRGQGITDGNFRGLQHTFVPTVLPPMAMDSCFGGLAFYSKKAIEGCDYMPENETAPCEHQNLHRCIRKRIQKESNQTALILFNPYQVVNYKTKN